MLFYEYLPDLKKCPFCGDRAVMFKTPDGKYYIMCDNIDCPIRPSTLISPNKDKLIQAWNTRPDNFD